jgi:hypothetical protein
MRDRQTEKEERTKQRQREKKHEIKTLKRDHRRTTVE